MELPKAKPTVANVSLTDANTEYSQALPAGTKGFLIRLRNTGFLLRVAIDEGVSGTTYFTVQNGETHNEKNVKFPSATLYMQSNEPNMVAEILSWR